MKEPASLFEGNQNRLVRSARREQRVNFLINLANFPRKIGGSYGLETIRNEPLIRPQGKYVGHENFVRRARHNSALLVLANEINTVIVCSALERFAKSCVKLVNLLHYVVYVLGRVEARNSQIR